MSDKIAFSTTVPGPTSPPYVFDESTLTVYGMVNGLRRTIATVRDPADGLFLIRAANLYATSLSHAVTRGQIAEALDIIVYLTSHALASAKEQHGTRQPFADGVTVTIVADQRAWKHVQAIAEVALKIARKDP